MIDGRAFVIAQLLPFALGEQPMRLGASKLRESQDE